MSALEEKYKADGNLSGIDNVKLEFARNQLTSAFKYLNTISPAVNLFKDKAEKWGPYYTAEQIDRALLDVGCIQSAAIIGAIGLIQGIQMVEPTISNSEVFSPMNQGPLPDAVANTFRSGTYTGFVTEGEMTLYRVYGGKAGELSSYWTPTYPQGPLQSIIDYSLDPKWGNTATNIATINVPAGTTIYQGYAAKQGGLVGGGIQIYIPEVDPLWLVK